MAVTTDCQTPDAVFSTRISSGGVEIKVTFPHDVELDEHQAEQLEGNLHNAVELALAPLFAGPP